ncbi:MAG: tRNA(Ile)-lysidine synthase [Methanoregula sp.]|nr:tRNA(Ile)-lysidine synthase [Methanoregula sp.]
MQCSKCPRDAIVFQRYSGLHLCSQHSIADVEAKAKKMIRLQGWLRPGDHIAVLLSGDQSSSALLYFLKKLTAQRRDIRITAISIAGGAGAQNDISHAKQIAEGLDTGFLEVSWPEEVGTRMTSGTGKDQDVAYPPSKPTLPDRIAQRYGITKIAWGLCLDDAAGVVLESVLRGEGERLIRYSSCQDAPVPICPFISVTSAEVSLYAELCGCGGERTMNLDQGDELHRDAITMLNGFTHNHPATKYALLNLAETLAGPGKRIAGLIQACAWYGQSPRSCCNDSPVPHEVTDGTR